MFVAIGERCPGRAQVPGQVAGEHTEQHVGFDPVGQPVPDRAQVEVVLLMRKSASTWERSL